MKELLRGLVIVASVAGWAKLMTSAITIEFAPGTKVVAVSRSRRPRAYQHFGPAHSFDPATATVVQMDGYGRRYDATPPDWKSHYSVAGTEILPEKGDFIPIQPSAVIRAGRQNFLLEPEVRTKIVFETFKGDERTIHATWNPPKSE